MWFEAHTFGLNVAQAACVALPASGLPGWLERFRGRAWALVLPLSIAVVVVAITVVPTSATALSWIAFVLVPPGCALALGWAAHGSRPWLASISIPLLAVAWAFQDRPSGQVAATLLIAGSAVTLGRLLAGVAPLSLLKAGVVLMAAVDAYLVFSGQLEAPNAVLVAANPPLGLPRLQSGAFGGSTLGYGDFFAAAVVGGVLAAQHSRQVVAALAMLVVTLGWNQLFTVYDVLPATIPPAVVLLGSEVLRRRSRARRPRDGAPARQPAEARGPA